MMKLSLGPVPQNKIYGAVNTHTLNLSIRLSEVPDLDMKRLLTLRESIHSTPSHCLNLCNVAPVVLPACKNVLFFISLF